MAERDDDEERLLERLREAMSGDAAMRQLRRRYDTLREDYELLLDRLADLEQRVERAEASREERSTRFQPGRQTSPPPPPRAAPQHTAAPAAAEGTSLADTILAPLVHLREEYLAAAARIETIVSGLESLAAGAMKGQRPARPADEEQPSPPQEDAAQREARSVQVDVKGEGFGNLLDFQEKLSEIAGVARVSISAIDNDRATLVVELEGDD